MYNYFKFLFALFASILFVKISAQNNLVFTIQTDPWGYESSWDLINSSGVIVQNAPPNTYASNSTIVTNINGLPSGTYTFNMRDSYGDGLQNPAYYKLAKADGTIIVNYSGNFGTIQSTTFTLNSCTDNQTPTNVAVTASPASGTVNTSINFTGTAADNVGITKIEFYQGNTKLGEDLTAPYTLSYIFTSTGTYSITSKAFDACGNNAISLVLTLSITATDPCSGNLAPNNFSITAPVNGYATTLGTAITIISNPSDPNNNLSRIEYYDNGVLIGSSSSNPYNYTWNSPAIGSHIITAKAFDACNASSTLTSGIGISVNGTSSSGNAWSSSSTAMPTYREGAVHIGKSNTITGVETGYNLFVKGGIKSERFKVEVPLSGGWADYVFSDGYKQWPIKILNHYIKSNKHLPGFPSDNELAKSGGYDLGDMMKCQQVSLENLYLYIISLERRLTTLQALEQRMLDLERKLKKQ